MGWVFKIVEAATWRRLSPGEPWPGTPLDRRDGFVHLSTHDQIAGTLAKHFPGRDDLLLLFLEEADLPQDSLRWEPSRGGALFPHLYAPLDPAWVRRAEPLALDARGVHVLPEPAELA